VADSVVPCYRGGHHCRWPACPLDCDGRPGLESKRLIVEINTRLITFRGEDHTLFVEPGTSEWTLYRGASRDEFDDLTEAEVDYLNEYVYDWRTGQ
jgi:hypothetical protein